MTTAIERNFWRPAWLALLVVGEVSCAGLILLAGVPLVIAVIGGLALGGLAALALMVVLGRIDSLAQLLWEDAP